MTSHGILLRLLEHFISSLALQLRQLRETSLCHHEVEHLVVIRLLGVDGSAAAQLPVVAIQIHITAFYGLGLRLLVVAQTALDAVLSTRLYARIREGPL